MADPPIPSTFAQDREFLTRHAEVLELTAGPSAIAVVPEWQARIATSTENASHGEGYGWLNRARIESGHPTPHINVFGGEDRFWLGPEGGQFALFFQPGEPFDLEHWQTPPLIDLDPYRLIQDSATEATFYHEGRLSNASGALFEVAIERTVRILDPSTVADGNGSAVVFESNNQLVNTGGKAWDPATGLLSIWILGMFKPGPSTAAILPYHDGPAEERGPIVNDRYFGKVPTDRLISIPGALLFRGDGCYRSKIGLSALRARPMMGSWDPVRELLTIVEFTMPDAPHGYVDSMWELQARPYGGDVSNSYNDGPAQPGAAPLGPFYELESSSPALALSPGQSAHHTHRTIHVRGRSVSTAVCRQKLGLDLADVERAIPESWRGSH